MPLSAQPSARLDITPGFGYLWHGLTRATGAVVQPAAGAGYSHKKLTVDGGVVGHFELSHGLQSQAGKGSHLGEADIWVRGGWNSGALRVQGGAVRYFFRGDSTRGGMGPANNTTELFLSGSLPQASLHPSVELWVDIDRVQGAYLRVSNRVPALAWPLTPFKFLYVETEAGFNLGQGPDVRPGALANFDSRGFTHAALGVTYSQTQDRKSSTALGIFSAGFRVQVNFDDATRRSGSDRMRDLSPSIWVGWTALLGGPTRSTR